jgi:putative nucleotidyltransferase with HDIG domain
MTNAKDASRAWEPSSHLADSRALRSIRIRTAIYGALFFVIATLALVWQLPTFNNLPLAEGDVSPRDIRAPRKLAYISEVRTQQERARAEAAVEDIYDSPQARIARQQIDRARAALAFVDMVRVDPYAGRERKVAWLGSLADVPLTPQVIDYLLGFDDRAWKAVSAEITGVLEQTMREEIRPTAQLEAVLRSVPARVSSDLTEEQNQTVTIFVRSLVKPNAFFNAEKTADARRKARESVQPISRTIEEGETIVRAGDVVDNTAVEALEELGLRTTTPSWSDIVGAAGFVLLGCVWLGLYLFRYADKFWTNQRYPTLLFTLLVAFTIAAKFMAPAQAVLPYLFPLAALSMLLMVLMDFQISLVATIFMATLVGYMAGRSLEIAFYAFVGGLIGPMVLGRAERLSMYAWAGLFVALVNAAVILAFRLPGQSYDALGLAVLLGAGLANGLVSAGTTVASFYFLGSIFGITTSLRLMELSRPNHPLLRQLLLSAPGTYHHSILVSNLAEEAANRIGADALLTRVGSYYHDIGKSQEPYLFIENQMDGVNVHDRFDPQTSATLIHQHVSEGIRLAREAGLPEKIVAFIPEHHGTTLAVYFYSMAVKAAGDDPSKVSEDDYRYPGPKPQSRETAVVMLADGSESAVRSKRPTSIEQINEIVDRMIRRRLEDGQLDESDLTMRDLQKIREAFVEMLEGVFHPRIPYPETRRPNQPKVDPVEMMNEPDKTPVRESIGGEPWP